MVVPVYNVRKEPVGEYTLPGDIFDVPIRRDILQRVVRWQLAKKQQGTHKTKTRAEVSGGGRKPHAQKGSGRARAGSIRAPQVSEGVVDASPSLWCLTLLLCGAQGGGWGWAYAELQSGNCRFADPHISRFLSFFSCRVKHLDVAGIRIPFCLRLKVPL